MNGPLGHIIILAFPDTFVKMSDEWFSTLLPWLGLGHKGYIKAGHAAMVLVAPRSGRLHYFDFGRYETPVSHGRVRSTSTDAELEIPIQASFCTDGRISNLNEILLWLEAHPERTHGKGRMVASVCHGVVFESALEYALERQKVGVIPYGAFRKGSNCARFVTETLLQASNNKRVRRGLKRIRSFTPSAIGNVAMGRTEGPIFEVYNGAVSIYKGSPIRENLVNYFSRRKEIEKEKTQVVLPKGKVLHKLEGVGSSAYFEIERIPLSTQYFRIRRYNENFECTFDGVYFSEEFNETIPFQLTYDSHCAHCHVIQQGRTIRMSKVADYPSFSSWRRGRSA